MVVFNGFTEMSTTGKPMITMANALPAGTGSSEFSQEQWLDLLRVLSPSSRTNLQLALKQFLDETDQVDLEPSRTLNTHRIRKKALPDASTLVHAMVPLDNMPQNTYGTDRYVNLLRQSLDLDGKSIVLSQNHPIPTVSLDPLNGLDTLASAALATTNSETNVVPSLAITTIQGKPITETGVVAIPIPAQIAPALLSDLKSDQSQRQSPTIRETPKRLAATRAAAAEQAAAAALASPTESGLLHSSGSSNAGSKRSRTGSDKINDLCCNTTLETNLLISNGGLMSSMGSSIGMKPDPESTFHYQPETEAHGTWVVHQPPGSNVSTDSNKRRGRDDIITDDEVARREKRRERNRVAAAKCRQNRQNQIDDLKARRKVLEDEGNQTQQQIKNLLHEKAQIEELLKKHAHNGCPTAAQYFRNGTLILRIADPTPSGNCLPTSSIRIIQPTSNVHSSSQITSSPSAVATSISAPLHHPIKLEAPGLTPITFVPNQRPNTLPLMTPANLDTPTLDSAVSMAEQLWSPSVAAKIKTPGGESWVNSQIGLPPLASDIKIEHNINSSTATTTTILSATELLQQLGISLNSASTPPKTIQITVTNAPGSGAIDPNIKVTSAF